MRIGFLAALTLLSSFWVGQAQDQIQFSVEADRSSLALDESLTVKFKLELDGSVQGDVGEPKYVAPDFIEINSYQSNFMQSIYENGRFTVKNTRQITKVLRPQKTGKLVIEGFSIDVAGKTYRASPVSVEVLAAGQGATPPKGYGGNIGLGGAGKSQTGRNFFVRAEVNKNRAYKGEQLIVSYYLYRRVSAFNLEVTKYPVLNGFLREDMDLPIVRQSGLQFEAVTLDGSLYQRALLARYAAYPLKEGKLPIDSMALKFSYYPKANGGGISEDDYDPFMQFFRQMAPQVVKIQSDPVNVESLPLPEIPKDLAGKKFSGIVGQFDLMAAIDRTEVKVNEAVSLTVRVEGRGSLSGLKELDLRVPPGLDPFESKSSLQSTKEGISERTFEYVLLARTAGEIQIPPVELVYFDPNTKRYEVKASKPMALKILPGSGNGVQAASTAQKLPSETKKEEDAVDVPRPLKGNASDGEESSTRYWTWLYRLGAIVFVFFFILVGYDYWRRKKTKGEVAKKTPSRATVIDPKKWDQLKKRASKSQSREEILALYGELQELLSEVIKATFGMDPKSHTRLELKEWMVREGSINAQCWKRLEEFWSFADVVQFASPEGSSNAQTAKDNVFKWIEEARSLCQEILRVSPVTASHSDPSIDV